MCCLSFDDDGEELGCFFSLLKCDARTGSSSSFKTSGATALKYAVLSDENKRSQRDRKGRIREREKGREPFFQFPLATTKNNRASRGRMDGSRLASCVRRSRLSRVRLSPLERERDREMHESGRDRAGERSAPAEREGERDCSFFLGGGVNWGLRRRKISAKNVDRLLELAVPFTHAFGITSDTNETQASSSPDPPSRLHLSLVSNSK